MENEQRIQTGSSPVEILLKKRWIFLVLNLCFHQLSAHDVTIRVWTLIFSLTGGTINGNCLILENFQLKDKEEVEL